MWRFSSGKRGRLRAAILPAAAVLAVACHKDVAPSGGPASSASVTTPGGLTPELAAKVLVKIGDRAVTLGDYATTLAHMDRFERLRYQTADRRKQLLDEMIDIELLAREAERRGLADRPETKELARQILRDQVRRDIQSKIPPADQIPAGEVRAYFEAHASDFREPERRRISHIALKDRATADRVLTEARGSTPKTWGELVQKYSADKPPGDVPVELAGDLGLVTAPLAGKTDNPRVPGSVRAAAFEIEKVSDVLGRVVEDGPVFHVVRLTGKNEARARTLEEADRPIRVRITQERIRQAEDAFEEELRTRYPVQIDPAALSKVSVPGPGKSP